MVVLRTYDGLLSGSPEYFERALLELNAIRTEHGQEALQSLPSNCVRSANYYSCIVGRSLGSEVLATKTIYDVRSELDYEFALYGAFDEFGSFLKYIDRVNSPPQPTFLCDLENRFEDNQFPELIYGYVCTFPELVTRTFQD